MTELIQVRKKAQVTLPLSVRTQLRIEEGDYLDVNVKDGAIVMKVKKLIDKDQQWFWTRRWQEGEQAAQEDIQAGRTQKFGNADEAIKHLQNESGKLENTADK